MITVVSLHRLDQPGFLEPREGQMMLHKHYAVHPALGLQPL